MMAPEIFDHALSIDVLDDLEVAVLSRAQPGRPYPGGANRGGWKSGTDLLSWPEPAIGTLKHKIAALLDICGGYKVGSSWAVVNKNGSYHGRHRHGAPIMGILFVASGDPMVPTIFEVDGRPIEIEPVRGRLVLSGDLYHWVGVYSGSSPRIAIAFDAKLGAA